MSPLEKSDNDALLQDGQPILKAYRTEERRINIIPALPDRTWMGAAEASFTNRCLPMRIANQNGWFLLNPAPIEIVWNGGHKYSDLTIRALSDEPKLPAFSHFGYGLLTWSIPFLFRTSPGYNMHVRGPANWCKDGIAPLSAIVETDWAVASFQMNWKMTRIDHAVRFEKDEPFCMISPEKRGEVESFVPFMCPITREPELEAGFFEWSKSRNIFIHRLRIPNTKEKWQKHYFLGTHPLETRRITKGRPEKSFEQHQIKLQIRPFPPEIDLTSGTIPNTSVTENRDACPVHISNDEQGSVVERNLVHVDDFFEDAEEMRRFIDLCLGQTHNRTDVVQQVWQYLYEPNAYMLLRANPAQLIPRDLLERFRVRLTSHIASKAPRCEVMFSQLSLFVGGCMRGYQSRPPSDGLRFIYSLSHISNSKPLVRVKCSAQESREDFALGFNQILLLHSGEDEKILPIANSMNPTEGIILLEGAVIIR